ncbi:MAG: hypothetical protein HC881_17395 [Leptolyngbyaceae cyanobacterium SL_7_1]|nr:hypothetical protein [Leptolyngbyaceae cyanobacterium SL_7_1]
MNEANALALEGERSLFTGKLKQLFLLEVGFMFVLTGLALSSVTSLFVAVLPFLAASLGSLLGFAIPRAAQLPRYIKVLVLLYQNSDPNSQTRKYTTSALLILGGYLAFMAHSFIPFTGAILIGAVTTPIALLLTSVVILATLDLVTRLNEPYLENIHVSYREVFQDMEDDLLSLKNILGPSWKVMVEKIQAIFEDLNPRVAELGEEVASEINKYFGSQLPELVIYLDTKNSSKLVLNDSDIRTISESLEPWKKVGGSLLLGTLTGTGTGMAASTVAAATVAPATWWTSLVPGAIQTVLVGGKTVVGAAAFSAYTVAAPIALGLTIGTGVFSATMFALGKIEEHKLSQFLADVIIASLPMVRADKEFSEDEKLVIQQFLANPKIQQQDKDRVYLALSSNESFDDIISKNLLYEQKEEKTLIKRRLLLSITWEIAKADGKVDEQEVALHNRMAKILQIPEETVTEIRRLITPKLLLQSSN